MAAARNRPYSASADVDELEALANKLAEDLREKIVTLDSPNVLSKEWCDMADTVGRIASISEMEARLPKKSQSVTLWECEELALRHVLEDGKLNLCLRNLVEYKRFARAAPGRPPADQQHMIKFEKGMGLILRNAWRHIEALQLTDLPLLFRHVSEVLADATNDVPRMESLGKQGDLVERQEVMVLHYLHGVASQLGEMPEYTVMPFVREERLLAGLVRLLDTCWQLLPERELGMAVETMAFICDTEDFQNLMDEGDYLSPQDLEVLGRLHVTFIDNMTNDADVRRKIRPLLDVIVRSQYK